MHTNDDLYLVKGHSHVKVFSRGRTALIAEVRTDSPEVGEIRGRENALLIAQFPKFAELLKLLSQCDEHGPDPYLNTALELAKTIQADIDIQRDDYAETVRRDDRRTDRKAPTGWGGA